MTKNVKRILDTINQDGFVITADLHHNTVKALLRSGKVREGRRIIHARRYGVLVSIEAVK